VAAGVPAAQILTVYTQRSKEIFTPGPPFSTMKRLVTGYMYNPENIQKVISDQLGSAARWTLNDSPIRLLITSKGIDHHAWYFVKDNPKNRQSTGKLGLVDCAVASAAAPTYFGPWNVPGIGVCVDGGVGVTGDPVYQVCVEAFEYDDFAPGETRVVSLGTGFYRPAASVPSGLLGWLKWTIGALLDAPEEQQPQLVNRQWPGVMTRFDWELPQEINMDDTANIELLVSIGQRAAAAMDWNSILGIT
jgi:hypothetical protein